MKFEKLNENKIRITLTNQDLIDKKIDFNMFISNPIESQDILIDMLEEAKKNIGFDAENYNLKIEALSMSDTSFVFTITKEIPESKVIMPKKNFKVKRKHISPSSTQAIYLFNSFDDFCLFLEFLHNNNFLQYINKLALSVVLYEYNNSFYLLLNNVNTTIANKLNFYANISEFAKCVTNSKIFACKLIECGKLILDNNALDIASKYFIS